MLDIFDNPQINWKAVILGLTIGRYAFESYLDYRQYLVACKKERPEALKAEFTQEKFEKSQEYTRARIKFGFFSSAFLLLQSIFVIKYDVLAKFWNIGGTLMQKSAVWLPKAMSGTITQSMFMMVTGMLASLIISLPFSYYKQFVLEEKFGFNKMTFKLWVLDTIKGLILQNVILVPFASGFLKIIDIFNKSFVLYAGGFVLVVQLILMTVYPILIAPLFNKFTPLEDGELKDSINELAAKNNFPLAKVYVIDGSTRSSHSNAYFTGLPWSKRIVLFDTLINHSTVEETVAVLAHEIGHWKKSHLFQMVAFSEVNMLITFTLLTAFIENKSLYSAFGFNGITPALVGFILFESINLPVDCLTTFLFNLLSRTNEFEADRYAVESGYREQLARSLIKLNSENLGALESDWLYAAYQLSHPGICERLTALGYISKEKLSKQE